MQLVDRMSVGDIPAWLTLVAMVAGGIATSVIGWVVIVVTVRQKLTDHIDECDRRYTDLNQKIDKSGEKLDAVLERLPRKRWLIGR